MAKQKQLDLPPYKQVVHVMDGDSMREAVYIDGEFTDEVFGTDTRNMEVRELIEVIGDCETPILLSQLDVECDGEFPKHLKYFGEWSKKSN